MRLRAAASRCAAGAQAGAATVCATSRSVRLLCALLVVVAVLLGFPGRSYAQDLERVESLLLRGRLTDARSALALWKEQNPRAASEQKAYATLLGAQLATSATSATDAYLALALTYPTSRHAPVALLRLGQGLLAANEPERARGYLERLVRDYPNAPDRAEAMLWLARAERATGRDAAACATVREAGTLQTRAETLLLIEAEEARVCASS